MHINSNEIPSQNQLTIDRVIHKILYILNPLNFVNIKQSTLFHISTEMKPIGGLINRRGVALPNLRNWRPRESIKFDNVTTSK